MDEAVAIAMPQLVILEGVLAGAKNNIDAISGNRRALLTRLRPSQAALVLAAPSHLLMFH
jgi:hypothetical protein